jgi:hypothetical protein
MEVICNMTQRPGYHTCLGGRRCWEINKKNNDSLFTYFDGKYNRYKRNVNYISLFIQENYAIDKDGRKL